MFTDFKTKRGQKRGHNRGRHSPSADALLLRQRVEEAESLGYSKQKVARNLRLREDELDGLLSGRLTVPCARWGLLLRNVYGAY